MMAFWLLIAAARAFDLREFTGLSALLKRPEKNALNAEVLVTSGVLSVLRHPWYAAGLLLLWLRDQTYHGFISSLVLSIYLLIGSLLEERRLMKRFGQAYEDYRRAVPMFLPAFLRRKS